MLLPNNIPHTLYCPHCHEDDNKANLKWNHHTPSGGYFTTEYLCYHCDKCDSGFTTTETDIISLNRYHSKKRSLVRKDKISKLRDEENFYIAKK
jgi:hypothetical protein